MQNTKFIFLNGKIISDTEGCISLGDRGFLYGDGIFETLRSYKGNPFKLTEHLKRLRSSAKKLKIPFEYTNTEINRSVQKLLKKNNILDAYIRITLTRGTGENGLEINGNFDSTLLIQIKPFKAYERKLYEKGTSLIVSKVRRSASCPISCHKTTNLLTSILLKEEVKRKSAHEAIILNTDGHVAECIFSNIFIVNNKTVITPSLDTNILPGITRRIVLDICKNNNISISEERFKVETLLKAKEAFITNSLMEIMPVSKVEDYEIGETIPGKITKQIESAYKRLI
ncbi:MAG: branched-chain amino acid aminotransferase [Candidatus Scalindua rubra]|uniref:Branched-chain amino acid aminotransferase n=1 Tax=Candidatus Scalindua rubra TaxID=1872076 RepID=A0A1E3XAV0_9BACT|nr:MAG: branched-chain amino acid aminotransferase [Candidatus Scalindua rubra]